MNDSNTDGAFSGELISSAIIAYLEWGQARTPQRNHAAVVELAPCGRADELIETVLEIIQISDKIEIGGKKLTDPTSAPDYRAQLAALVPSLSPEAARALGSRWFFNSL